jgi:ribosomal-protein-alanine N-acetyltransferase
MTEALAPVLAYGLDGVGLNRVEACPLAENTASNALLLRLGFKHEGNLRQRVFFRGRFVDQYYYSLLKSEWNSRTMG